MLIKHASPEQDFEQSFFQLAYDKLQEKLYNLLPFLVGFEIVNKEEDGTKALGVFAFKSNNNQIIYVPAFFLDGTVKGLDILYSKNNEQFYPLNEDFAELFLKDDVTGIGDTSPESKQNIQKSIRTGDLKNLVTPPRTGKTAFAEFVGDVQKTASERVFKETKHTSLVDFVKDADPVVKKAFQRLFEENDDFCESVLRYYPLDKVAEAITLPKAPVKIDERELKLITSKDNAEVKKLAEAQKEKLLTDGYLILDKRAEEQKTKFGLFNYAAQFSTPNETGFYSYITENGGLRLGLIIVCPQRLKSEKNFGDMLVIDLDSKDDMKAYSVPHTQVLVKNRFIIKEFPEVQKMMEEPAEVKPSFDDSYILINDTLHASEPFKVKANFKDDMGVRRLQIEFLGSDKDKDRKPTAGILVTPAQAKTTFLVMTKRTGNGLDYRGNNIFVPKGFKLLNLNVEDPTMDSGDDKSPRAKNESKRAIKVNTGLEIKVDPKIEDRIKEKEKKDFTKDTSEDNQGRPGGAIALNSALSENNVYPFAMSSNGSEFVMTIPQARKKVKYSSSKAAKIGMVMDLGFGEKDAEELINNLVPGISKKGYVKLAYLGQQTHTMRDPVAYTNELGQPTYTGESYEETMNTGDGYTGDPTQLGLGDKPDVQGIQSSISQATQLAQAGQKQIFDTHSIAALAKYVSPSSKIFSYMPDFVAAMDKLGRLLFLIYWETDKFEEMYGRGEVPELVELTTNVFKNIGDLVIFLKRKSPALDINMKQEELSV